MTSPQPRLLNLNTPTVRNQRTLVWLDQQDPSIPWSVWDGVVTSLEAYRRWSTSARIVGIILLEETPGWTEELYALSSSVAMIFLPQRLLRVKSQAFWEDNFDNVMCLEAVYDSYPFLMSPWTSAATTSAAHRSLTHAVSTVGTVEEAKQIMDLQAKESTVDALCIMALLGRYHRLVGVDKIPLARREALAAVSVEPTALPEQVWMVTQYYRPAHKKRAKEIRQCLKENCANPLISRIVLLNEKDESNDANKWYDVPGHEKIHQVVIGTRLTYADFIQYVYDKVPSHVFTILCNADIYWNETLQELWRIQLANRMLGLLRWDIGATPCGQTEPKLFGPRADSQDSWIFLSDSIKDREWDLTPLAFCLGQPGCDNAFAGHMLRNRFALSNPAYSIQSLHLHRTEYRTYDKRDTVPATVYINLAPGHLIDMKQERVPTLAPPYLCHELVPFEIRSSSMSNEITYCTMLEKEGRYTWEPTVENNYFEPAIPYYVWNKAAVTPNGLVYDQHTIYLGKHAEDPRFQYWTGASVDLFTPLLRCETMLALPFADTSVFRHPNVYVLQYLSRALRLWEEHPFAKEASFWLPRDAAFSLSLLLGDRARRGIPWREDTACWAQTVVGGLPGPLALEIGKEDITALRTWLPAWEPRVRGMVCTVLLNETAGVTRSFVQQRIAPWLQRQDRAWMVRTVNGADSITHGSYSAMLGTALCVFLGGAEVWAPIWALPKEACVVEFQQELKLQGESQHVAHMAELIPWVLLLAKGTVEDVQDQIMEQLEKWYRRSAHHITTIMP